MNAIKKVSLIICLLPCILFNGCGTATRSVTEERASISSSTDRALTAEELAMQKLVDALSDIAPSIKTVVGSTDETIVQEKAQNVSGFGVMSVDLFDNSNEFVSINNYTRLVNGQTETVSIRSVFYLDDNPTNTQPFNIVERIVSIDSNSYSYVYPEKIVFTGLNEGTITKLDGYSATMTHKTKGISATILSRDVTFNSEGTYGTMFIDSIDNRTHLSGTLNISIAGNSFSANGDLNIGNQKAVNLKIDNNGTVTITNLFGPDNSYYYNANRLPPATNSELTLNLAPNTTYEGITLSSGATAYANKLTIINGDKTATINGTLAITAYNSHLGVFLQDLIFNVPANQTAITGSILTPLSIKNCTFVQNGTGAANPGLLEIKNTSKAQGASTIRGTVIENCTFLGNPVQNATGIYISEKGNPRLTVSNCLFRNLEYGVYSVSKLPDLGTNEFPYCSNEHN